MAYKGRDESVYKGKKDDFTPFQEKCLKRYDEFLHKDIDLIKYKVHKRAAVQVKGTTENIPHLYAKDLSFPFNRKHNAKDIDKLNKTLTRKNS